jgi:hypothetical protein
MWVRGSEQLLVTYLCLGHGLVTSVIQLEGADEVLRVLLERR